MQRLCEILRGLTNRAENGIMKKTAGGFALICLLGAGLVFRKKE